MAGTGFPCRYVALVLTVVCVVVALSLKSRLASSFAGSLSHCDGI